MSHISVISAKAVWQAAQFAASAKEEETRPYLRYVYIQALRGSIVAMAADGRRIAIARDPQAIGFDKPISVNACNKAFCTVLKPAKTDEGASRYVVIDHLNSLVSIVLAPSAEDAKNTTRVLNYQDLLGEYDNPIKEHHIPEAMADEATPIIANPAYIADFAAIAAKKGDVIRFWPIDDRTYAVAIRSEPDFFGLLMGVHDDPGNPLPTRPLPEWLAPKKAVAA